MTRERDHHGFDDRPLSVTRVELAFRTDMERAPGSASGLRG